MSTEDLDQIARLFRLRESGALTQAEFEAEKARVLNEQDSAPLDGEAPGAEPIVPVAYAPASPADDAMYRDKPPRSRLPLVPILLATILVIVAAVGWYVMRGNTATVEPDVASNAVSPAPAPSLTVAAAPQANAEQSAASLYQWATSIEPLGVTPNYLTSKLGTPRRREGSTLDFVVAGCDIRYETQGSAISYFDAEVSPSCKPSLTGLNAATAINLPQATSLAAVERKAGGLIVADCLEMCGNAADPAQYLFIQGPHADNFINVAIVADPQASKGTEKWALAIRTAHNLSVDDELPAQSFQCGADAALQELGPVRIGRVLVGQGVSMESLTMCGVDTN
jgi:hypothetical protein